MTKRWPVHPTPYIGEALTSWLQRLAAQYGTHIEQLVYNHLIASDGLKLGLLDVEASTELVNALSERTGVQKEQILRMTINGWVPWLIDSLRPEQVPGIAFDTYVRQHSVIIPAAQHPHRMVTNWRAWLPLNYKNRPMIRLCPVCVEKMSDSSFAFPLIMRLPITLSCPEHECRMNAAFGAYEFCGWEHNKANDKSVPRQIIIQDARTSQGMSTGRVTLPRRPVHVGVWFRLLRTVIEELSIPLSKLRTQPRQTMELIWKTAGHPVRAGIIGATKTYETLPWVQQEMYLEAAATAIHLVETGVIEARGTFGHLFKPEPDRPELDSLPQGDAWDEARDILDCAQFDARAAEYVMRTLTRRIRSEKTFQIIRSDLIDIDIPEAFLPLTLSALQSQIASPNLSLNTR